MARIELTQGKVTTVDADDYQRLSRWKWHAMRATGGKWYAVRKGNIRMHREILKVTSPHIDHIDGDGLNNQRNNLRAATHSQNGINTDKYANNTSGFKGVSWHKASNAWRASLQHKRVRKHLGLFKTAAAAARAYDRAAFEVFGIFACLNFPHQETISSADTGDRHRNKDGGCPQSGGRSPSLHSCSSDSGGGYRVGERENHPPLRSKNSETIRIPQKAPGTRRSDL